MPRTIERVNNASATTPAPRPSAQRAESRAGGRHAATLPRAIRRRARLGAAGRPSARCVHVRPASEWPRDPARSRRSPLCSLRHRWARRRSRSSRRARPVRPSAGRPRGGAGRRPRRQVRRTVEEVAIAEPAARVTWQAGPRSVSWTATCHPPPGAGPAVAMSPPSSTRTPTPAVAHARAASRSAAPGLGGGAEVEHDVAGKLEAVAVQLHSPPARHGAAPARDGRAVRRQELDAAVVAQVVERAAHRRVHQTAARLGGVQRRPDEVGQQRARDGTDRGSARPARSRDGTASRPGRCRRVRPARSRRPHAARSARSPRPRRWCSTRRTGRSPPSSHDPLVVACGALLLGGVTGLGCCRACWVADRLPPLPAFPDVPAWPEGADSCVCVARPRPRATPRVLSTPSPASPAWSRLLRWKGVMRPRWVGLLWRACEPRGSAVSFA